MVAVAAMYIGMVYENVILSNVTVTMPPFKHNSLKDLLDDGYKFLWNAELNNNVSPLTKSYFQTYFKLRKEYDRFNSSFYRLPNEIITRLTYTAKMLKKKGIKLASYHDKGIKADKQIWRQHKKFVEYYGKEAHSVSCHVLKDEI